MALGPTVRCPNCNALIPLPIGYFDFRPGTITVTRCTFCSWFKWRLFVLHKRPGVRA